MMNAYDKLYLDNARKKLGVMLDYGVNVLRYKLDKFWFLFINSDISMKFERGDASVIDGRSGVELALMVVNDNGKNIKPYKSFEKSEVYWLGWALAYYQWLTGLCFYRITEEIDINEIIKMYNPYHEMDIRHFCDKLTEIIKKRKTQTNLKKMRLAIGISQSQLSNSTGIPIRTIQQYEQGQKNINRARSDYLISLSRALYCKPELLLEIEENND